MSMKLIKILNEITFAASIPKEWVPFLNTNFNSIEKFGEHLTNTHYNVYSVYNNRQFMTLDDYEKYGEDYDRFIKKITPTIVNKYKQLFKAEDIGDSNPRLKYSIFKYFTTSGGRMRNFSKRSIDDICINLIEKPSNRISGRLKNKIKNQWGLDPKEVTYFEGYIFLQKIQPLKNSLFRPWSRFYGVYNEHTSQLIIIVRYFGDADAYDSFKPNLLPVGI